MSKPLKEQTALVVGLGSLGGPAALVLAAGGVGRLLLVDGATVTTADLNRQPLFAEADVGAPKAAAAARRLQAAFPALAIEPSEQRLDEAGARALVERADVVVEGTGHFPTMFAVNDAAAAAGRPLVHGAVLQLIAQLTTVRPGATGCLRCLFEGPPPPGTFPGSADTATLGPMAGFAGALLGWEALRLLAGEPGAYEGQVLMYEGKGASSRAVRLPRREGCPACASVAPPAPAPAPATVA